MSLFGQQCGPFQVYESFGNTTIPTQGGTWTATSISYGNTNSARSGQYGIVFNAVNDIIQTPLITNPSTFSFWYKRSNNTASWSCLIETSSDGSVWTTRGTINSITGSFQQYSIDLGALGLTNIYIRIKDTRTTGSTESRYVDDMSWTSTIATNNKTLIQGITCNPSIICGETYTVYDRGGVNDEYSISMGSAPMVISPASSGGIVTVNITSLGTESTYDFLKLYNGNSITSSAFPGSGFSGNSAPGTFVATTASGAITLDFTSDASSNGSGFVGTVTCAIPPPCSGTPNPGNTITSATSVSSGSSVNLSLQNTISGTGITYQWQSSSDNSTWTTISGATNATYTATVNASTWFRCLVMCSGNSGIATAIQVTVNYCIPTYANGFDYVTSVSLGTLYQATTSNSYPFYINYTTSQNAIPGLLQGSSYPITLTFNNDAYQYYGVWIDFNQSGTFETSEYFSTSTNVGANGTVTLSITVPSSALVGVTRMRIRGGEDTQVLATQPCNASSSVYGQAQDFLVNILSSTPCTGQPNAGTATINTSSGCYGTNIALNATGLSLGAGITYQWQVATSSSGPWTDIPGATSASYSTVPSATSYYRIKTVCSNSGQSNTSNSVSFTSSNCYVMSNNLLFVTTCTGIVYDSGGSSGNYGNNESKVLVIRPTSSDQIVTVTGRYETQSGSDYLSFDKGEDDDITTLYGSSYSGSGNVTFTSIGPGVPIAIQFASNGSTNKEGFALTISCACAKPTAISVNAPAITTCTGTSSITVTDVTAPKYKPWVMSTFENNILNSLTWLPINPTNAWVGNDATIGGQQTTLTPADISENGTIVFGSYGQNQNDLDLYFNMFVGNGTMDGDGLSFSYGPDIANTPIPNSSSTPSATFSTSPYYFEMGIGSGLKISFDAYENGFDPNFPYCGGSNVEGVYLIYNDQVVACNATTTSSPFWLNDTVFVHMIISPSGQLTMNMDGSTIFNNVQLPAAYLAADKSTWKAAFAARTGTSSVYSGRNKHMVDDINIFHFTEYEYSIDGTTWQASNTFPNLQAGTYTVYVRIKGQSCSYDQSITITMPTSITPTFSNATSICTGGVSPLPTISTNNISGTWSPAFNNTTTTTYTFTPTYGQCALPVTSTIAVDPCGPFTSCNLVVNKIGNGTTSLSSSAASIAVQEISPAGDIVQTISSSNFTGTNLLTQNGSSKTVGYLNSYNGFLGVAGWNSPVGTSNVNDLNSKAANIINENSIVQTRVVFPTGGALAIPQSPFSGDAIRSIVPLSNNTFYCSGTSTASASEPNTGGVWYYNGLGFIPICSTFNNVRNLEIFNGQLYYSTGSYDATTNTYSQGIYSVGVGLPTTTNQTASPLIVTGASASTSPNDFSISPDGCTAYIADDATIANNGGVQKWSKASGTWQLQYIIPVRSLGLLVDYSGTNPIIYVTTYETSNNKIVKITDNGTLASVLTTDLMLAGTNYVFRGIDFTPNSYKSISVSQHPQSTNYCQNANSVSALSVTATSSGAISYQWYQNTINSFCGATAIMGATSATYTPPASTVGTMYYFVRMKSSCATIVTSNIATITIYPYPSNPLITAGGATTFCQGGNVVLSTTNVVGYSYQWQNNGVNINGATGTTYTATTAGNYSVIVTNSNNCSSTSAATTIIIHTLPALPIITASGATTFCQGGNVVLSTTNVVGYSYQWQNNGSNINGATGTTYTATTAGSYTVIVTNNNNCSSTSTATSITINALPTLPVIIAGGPTIFCQGGSVILSTTNISGLSYQWQNNGSVITGATSSTYTSTISGEYTVVATNSVNCISTSISIIVSVNAMPQQPVAVNCWDNFQFNSTSCEWENSGSQPQQPPVVTCWDDYQFNTTICDWENIGIQPQQPVAVNCWDNFQFNSTSCDWENSGSQPQQPPVVTCWDDYQFNTAICDWENIGIQPQQPVAVNCWDNFQLNSTSCEWENSGIEPQEPSGLDCNQIASWNATTCSWDVQTNPLDVPLFSIVTISCYGSTITLPETSDNGINGTWSPAINNAQTTTYTFTPANGQCAATETVTITITPNASITGLNGTTTFNIGGSETFTTTAVELGGGIGVWSSSDPSVATVDPITGVVTAITSGTCDILYTISGGCGEASESITIIVSQNLEAILATTNHPTCSVATGTVTVTTPVPANGITYSLIGVNPVIASQSNETGIFTNLSPGDYELTYELSNLISSAYPLTINSQPSNIPGPSVGPITQPTCSISTGSIQAMNPTPTSNIEFTLTRTSPTPWTQSNFTGAFNGLSSGVYELTYTNELGCVSLPLTFTIFPFTNTPTVFIDNATVCSGQSATLTAIVSISGGTFLWSNSQTTPSINVSPSTTATYNVYYTLPGCTAVQASATVTVKPIPSVTLSSSLPVVCPGVSTTLAAIPSIGGGTYNWIPGNYTTQTINVTPTNTSNYSVTYTLDGCTSSASSTTITVSAPPTVSIVSANNALCVGESTMLTAIPSISGGAMQWVPTGETTEMISVQPTMNTTYSVSYTVNGCTVSSSVDVSVAQKPSVAFLSNVTGGCAPLHIDFQSSQTEGVNYFWLINGIQLSGNTINYTFNDEDCYDVKLIADQNGCKDSVIASDYICVTAKPTASFVPSSLVFSEYNQEITFTNLSQGADFYAWDFGDGGISELFQPSHVFNETENGVLISLTAISSSGCQDEFHLTIPFEPKFLYYVPNTFTPDRNGLNETFKPIISSGVDIYNYTLFIYNRWGELIFESHDVEVGWDGTYGTDSKKMEVQDGTYTWKIVFKAVGNADSKAVLGTVNLLR